MNTLHKDNRGISILGILFLGFIVLVVLGYYHISVRSVVNSPDTQDNIHYVGGGAVSFWNKYLEHPASYLWNDVWLPIFWRPFLDNMQKIRNNEPTDYQTNAPQMKIN